MGGLLAGQQRFQVVGHHLGLPRLSVPRRPADVGREHHIGHSDQRVIGRQPFADEVVQARGSHLAAAQRLDEGVGVVQLSAGAVEEDDAVAHGRELLGADQPGGVGGHRCVQRDDVGLGQQLVQAVSGLVVVGVVGDNPHAEARPAATGPRAPPRRGRSARPFGRPPPRRGSADTECCRRGTPLRPARRRRRPTPDGWRRRAGPASSRRPHPRCAPAYSAPGCRPRSRLRRRRCWGHRGWTR